MTSHKTHKYIPYKKINPIKYKKRNNDRNKTGKNKNG